MNIIERWDCKKLTPSVTSSCFNYYCISTVRKIGKVIATGQLDYSKRISKKNWKKALGTL